MLLALAVPADPFTVGGAACLVGLEDAEQPAQAADLGGEHRSFVRIVGLGEPSFEQRQPLLAGFAQGPFDRLTLVEDHAAIRRFVGVAHPALRNAVIAVQRLRR